MASRKMSNALRADLDKLAMACRILEMEGHGDMTLGHLSLRDPESRGFWMKRNAIGLGEVSDADDFVLVTFDGEQIAGSGRCHSEWPIHSEILLARDDINVVAHTHPYYTCVFSATDGDLRPVALEASYFGHRVPMYPGTGALVKTQAMGRELAEALGPARAVFMKNHGVTFCGESPEATALAGIWLERACRAWSGASPTRRRRRNATTRYGRMSISSIPGAITAASLLRSKIPARRAPSTAARNSRSGGEKADA